MTAPIVPALRVEDLRVHFRGPRGKVHAVNGMSYEVRQGETLGILGESGSGKSVQAQAIMGLLESPPAVIEATAIDVVGTNVLGLSGPGFRRLRGSVISMIFQDAVTALNPGLRIGTQLNETLRLRGGMDRTEARARAIELMERVGIPAASRRIDDYPHEFSGGMCQRIMIAMAISLEPAVLIADEPTTALDVTVQAQVMQLLSQLQTERGMAMVLITHDIGLVAETAARLVVMYAGKVMETGPTAELLRDPAHPYTRGLLSSTPRKRQRVERLNAIPGSPPSLIDLPTGCPFRPRCPQAEPACALHDMVPRTLGFGRSSSCIHARSAINV
ncbi:MAG: ABC transporter ATP-binding protein [Pararhodobacter sp.]|nr:ABC transporter ATP-binding protein [Pararhodobacter sp.]